MVKNLQRNDDKKDKDLKSLMRKNGNPYTNRSNRDRFFYPNEWMKFFDALKKSQKLSFDMGINTGSRINELNHIKVGDIDFERNNIILRVTKIKAKKGEKNPRPRTISISTQFSRRLKKYVNDNNLKNEDYLGLLSNPAAHICLKKTLKEVGIDDWYMFSIHNIRKTHGNWLKALGIDGAEICTRLGHDYNTFLKSYSSPDIFTFKDKQDMRLVLGDLYQK
jgi:integrase